MKTISQSLFLLLILTMAVSACKSFDQLLPNPNVASADQAVPASLILPRAEFDLYNQGDGGPFTQVHRWNQFSVSNNLYYGGQNQYNWTTTSTLYSVLKNVNLMETQANKALGVTAPNSASAYAALAKFFRAYIFVWQTNRVGDTPITQAGQGLANLTPAYDSQKAIFATSLALLDTANTILSSLTSSTLAPAAIGGDIYYNNDLTKWRKAINTYRLRVLISLSKRATDNADLNIPGQFAAIVNNPTKYPIMSSNADNLNFVFNSNYNTYPHTPNDGNNQYQIEGAPYLSITTATQDPRTFVFATPAPAQIAAGKKVGDFTAYAGGDPSKSINDLSLDATSGKASYTNNQRYYGSVAGPEPYIILGYSEMNFNIAEAINRGWVPGASASSYYLKGINASLSFYGLTEGQTYTVGDQGGKTLGTTTISIANFLANPGVVYKGDNADGLEQILNQKYVAFHQNSGYEAFYNWRRTGLPKSFAATGGGINSTGKIPRRWQYPVDEQTYNSDNYKAAVMSQFNGTDDLNMDTWLTK